MKLINYKKIKINKKHQEAKISVLVLVVMAAVLLLAGVQLVISHQLATAGGQIRALENEAGEMQVANLQLKHDMGEAGALLNIADRAAQLGLARTPQIVYLPSQVAVALK